MISANSNAGRVYVVLRDRAQWLRTDQLAELADITRRQASSGIGSLLRGGHIVSRDDGDRAHYAVAPGAADPVGASNTGRVSQALAGGGWMTARQVADATGLDGKIAATILSNLAARGRVHKDTGKAGAVYALRKPGRPEPPHPDDGPAARAAPAQSTRRAARTMPAVIAHRQAKVELLETIAPRLSGRAADLMQGILADYRR